MKDTISFQATLYNGKGQIQMGLWKTKPIMLQKNTLNLELPKAPETTEIFGQGQYRHHSEKPKPPRFDVICMSPLYENSQMNKGDIFSMVVNKNEQHVTWFINQKSFARASLKDT